MIHIYIIMIISIIISTYFIIELASILTFKRLNSSMSWIEALKNFYKSIKLLKIGKIEKGFCYNIYSNRVNNIILTSQFYFISIIDCNNVLLITQSTYQMGYTLLLYERIENTFEEKSINISDMPSPLYWYRYNKTAKLLKSINCDIIDPKDVNKLINDYYTVYNRDTKLKELLDEK